LPSADSFSLDAPASQRTVVWALVAWLLGVWWLSAQYMGFDVQDGLVYTAEALRRLEPHNFAPDLFFLGQSQGDFSVFGWVYATAIQTWGLNFGAFVLATLGRLAWGVAVVGLAATLWPRPQGHRWLACLTLMLLLPSTYSAYDSFQYGSPDITSRTSAELWVLLALVCHWRQRPAWAWGCAVLAALLHPLMALPALALLLLQARPRVRHVGLALGITGLGLGAALGIPPLDRMTLTFDPDWWTVVDALVGYILVQHWSALTLLKVSGLAALLLHSATVHPDARLRRLSRHLLVLLGLMLGLWVGACLTQNVLGVQLQLWRVLWLCQLLAPALWLSSLPAWRTWDRVNGAAVLLVMSGLLAQHVATAWLVWAGVALSWPRLQAPARQIPTARRLLPLAAAALAMMAWLPHIPAWFTRRAALPVPPMVEPTWVALAQTSALTLALTLVLALPLWWPRARTLWALPLLGCTLPLWVGGHVVWHQFEQARPAWREAHQLRRIIPEGAVVQWIGQTHQTWFALHRAQYIAAIQGPNGLFVRDAALLFQQRARAFVQSGLIGPALALPQANTPETRTAVLTTLRLQLEAPTEFNPSDAHLRTVCQDRALDFILVSLRAPGADHDVLDDDQGRWVSVYACARHRAQGG
jgi:hypothetical protein